MESPAIVLDQPNLVPPAPEQYHSLGPWTLNTHTNQLTQGNQVVELEHRLTNLLVYFLRHRLQILTKDDILQAIWHNKVVNDDSLSAAVSKLRKALDDNPRAPTYIKTIPGIGYQFIMQAAAPTSAGKRREIYPLIAHHRLWLVAAALLATIACALSAAHIGKTLKPAIASEQENRSSAQDDSELLQRASALVARNQQQGLRMAIPMFRQVIAQNPQAAEAYLGIAEAKIQLLDEQLWDMNNYVEIRGLLQKALQINPNLARAHMWLGHLLLQRDNNRSAAEEHFRISLSLDPKDDLSHFLYEQFLLVEKRFAEAREQIALARSINPLSYSYTYLAWTYLLERKYDLGLQELERIANTEQEDSYFHTAAQNIYYGMGNQDKVFEHMQWFFKQANYSQEKISTLEDMFKRGGLASVYSWLLTQQETLDLGQYPAPLAWARYAVAIGDKARALDYLEQAYEKRQFRLQCATADPRYDPLRNEPRFKILLQKLNTPITGSQPTSL